MKLSSQKQPLWEAVLLREAANVFTMFDSDFGAECGIYGPFLNGLSRGERGMSLFKLRLPLGNA